MIRKLILAAVAAAAITLPAAGPARAEVDIELNHPQGLRRLLWPQHKVLAGREHRRTPVQPCQAARLRGRTYTFTGKRKGKWYVIYVNSYTGRIVDVDRWYR